MSNIVETGTGTVSRALHVLRLVAEGGGPITVKGVSERLGLAPSTTHRLLQLLRQEGFVEALGPGQYGIGPQLWRVSSLVVKGSSIVKRAQSTIEQAALHFNETVMFGLYLPSEGALSFEGRADGKQLLTYTIEMHRPTPLIWGASGKSVLAFLDEDVIDAVFDREDVSPAHGDAKPAIATLKEELAQIRQQGWATTSSQKLPGALGIAAPIFGPNGIVGCICLTTPQIRIDPASIQPYGATVKRYADALSNELGAPTS